MTIRPCWLTAGWALLAGMAWAAEPLRDRDGDGIPDAQAETLGTDPAAPDVFHIVLDNAQQSAAQQKRPGYDPTKDVTRVEFCHAGDDRYVWRVTFAAPPRVEDMVLHLYIDADADSATGRKGPSAAASTGTDYMLSVTGGQGGSTRYTPEGKTVAGPEVRYVAGGRQLLLSADVELGRDATGIRYAMYVLCHTRTTSQKQPAMSDYSPKQLIAGIPVSNRKKLARLQDSRENVGVQATFGEDLLHSVLGAKDTLVVAHDQLELDGFVVDLGTSQRWPHVRLTKGGGRVWTTAPRAGRYHVGFMMYDDGSGDRVGIAVDGQLCGLAVAGQQNRRTWLYWLVEPRDFQGGERVELRALGSGSKHPICNILFLPRPPEVRTIRYAVESMLSATSVGRPGRVTLSWVTTWPSATRLEYGRDAKYGQTSLLAEPCLVHRVVLEGLDPQATYHARAVGTARDGTPFYGPDHVFTALPPDPPPTRKEITTIPLAVRNPHPFAVENWPITTGIPLPQGMLASPDQVRLMGLSGEVPAQISVTARWRDGSVKWLLLTFAARAPAHGEGAYRLEVGRSVRRAAVPGPIAIGQGPDGLTIDTGALRFRINPQGDLLDLQREGRPLIPAGAACATLVTDAQHVRYDASRGKARLEVEESGPLRAVIKVVQELSDGKHSAPLRVETRVEAYRDTALLRIQHTLLVMGSDAFTDLGEVLYRVPTAPAVQGWKVPLASGKVVTLDAATPALRQALDNQYVLGAGAEMAQGRVIGAALAADAGGCAVAVRDLWQNYPQGFGVAKDHIDLALCPAFAAGLYDRFPFEREGHHLYYYLLKGKYRWKRGMSKTHELLLCFAPEGQRQACCELFQQPVLATAAPEWYCGSKAFYDVAPRNPQRFQLYEEAVGKNLAAYVAGRERTHDFGMLNYGDWYPERGANWGNVEYDTQHAFFLEYIRSGNAQAFFLGEAAERHNRDVDTVQWDPKPGQVGAVYVHQMGHVGGYYDKSVPGTLGFPSSGFTVTHAWAEGHFDHYFLTGERRSYETGCAVSDYFLRKEFQAPYDFLSCREPGWHLIMLAAAYAATNDPYYLNAARVVVDRVLEAQDRQPRPLPDYQAAGRKPYQVGGWSRMLVPGHCLCEPRHRGNAGFMVAILLFGLKYYHDVTADPRVRESIILGSHYLLDECYSDTVHGFRYTSCPRTRYVPGASMLMVEGIARAYLWTKDERFRRVLTEALPLGAEGSAYGKSFSQYYRMAPRVLADLEAAGIDLNAAPAPAATKGKGAGK